MKSLAFVVIGLIPLLIDGCGSRFGYRHFSGLTLPAAEQTSEFEVGDDRSITFLKDRLEVTLLPVTADVLNRQFSAYSSSPAGFPEANPYITPTNPYTYGDWKPAWQDQAPARFTVFLLKVKNYAFPKVRVDPSDIEILAPNGRRYRALSLLALIEYYWPYAIAYAGNTYRVFKERTGLLQQTLFTDDMIFSGQEAEGYVVFMPLDNDVEGFTVWIRGMDLRFDYRDEPVDTVDIPYRFQREVYLARQPRTE